MARTVSSRLGDVAAALHRAPPTLAAARAVVEPGTTGLRRADANALALFGPEHLGCITSKQAKRIATWVRRIRGCQNGWPSRFGYDKALIDPYFGQPAFDGAERTIARSRSSDDRVGGQADRFAQLPRGPEKSGVDGWHAGEQPRLDDPLGEIVRDDERLYVAPPALAERVDKVESEPSGKPVPPRRATVQRQRKSGGKIHNRIVDLRQVTA